MKTQWYVAVASLALVGCALDPSKEDIETTRGALNGSLSPNGYLIRKSFNQTSEFSRESETDTYYGTVHVGSNGVSGGTIATALPNLTAFRSVYHFAGAEHTTYYYNRGDLGIGREMHCVDTFNSDGQLACYVTNYAAGDDNSEFTFGENTTVAFKNLDAGPSRAFATVAMVFRNNMATHSRNRVFFAVYGADGILAKAAALDRHGILFNNAFKLTTPNNPDPAVFGTPGVNFNNHIPSNCASCHGGSAYDAGNHAITDGQFLPFDLDQFDYESAAGRTRDDQAAEFSHQNEIVRKVAAFSQNDAGTTIKTQLDKWYGNVAPFQGDANEVFEHPFNSDALPTGWDSTMGATAAGTSIYRSVIRRSCRTCHVASAVVPFSSEQEFLTFEATAVTDLCNAVMPHSLQALRQFWQSSGPTDLEAYLRNSGRSTDADRLHACGPGAIVTLDPPQIAAALM
jgi:hypothetical protein